MFGGATIENGIDIYDEYVQCNHTVTKSPNQVASEIVQFYINAMREYTSKNGFGAPFPISVRVDNAAVGFIQILNNEAARFRVEH